VQVKKEGEREEKFVWVGDQNYGFTFLYEKLFLHGVLWPVIEFLVVNIEGSCGGHVLMLFGVVIL
jgi:hypothetical protein